MSRNPLNNWQHLPQHSQNQQNPPRNPPPATESSDLTPKPFTGARSAPVGAAEGPAYGFGVRSDDSVPGFGEFWVCRGKSCRFFDICPVDPVEIELFIKGGCSMSRRDEPVE